ncbi:hypothetical protein FRC12_005817 [Ceratobasidium sp. 428]|nr:hypothetical protein FRC12_005817 [Ceratobasidium sp. 428]
MLKSSFWFTAFAVLYSIATVLSPRSWLAAIVFPPEIYASLNAAYEAALLVTAAATLTPYFRGIDDPELYWWASVPLGVVQAFALQGLNTSALAAWMGRGTDESEFQPGIQPRVFLSEVNAAWGHCGPKKGASVCIDPAYIFNHKAELLIAEPELGFRETPVSLCAAAAALLLVFLWGSKQIRAFPRMRSQSA